MLNNHPFILYCFKALNLKACQKVIMQLPGAVTAAPSVVQSTAATPAQIIQVPRYTSSKIVQVVWHLKHFHYWYISLRV